MSITSVVNDTVTSVSLINAQKPLPPTITNYSVGGLDDTALDPAGGQTVQINGTGFLAGATITFDGNAVAVVTYVNPNRLTFTSPAKSAGTYTIYVVNPDGGTAIYIPGIIYSVLPTWTTSAGTLGSYYETTSISNTVVASGDAPITYSLYSGSLPTGSTLYANGVITGTAPVDSSSTTYSFTIEAIDAQLQGSTRSFSLTINVDVVTWVSPANATTYTSAVDSAIANVTLSATDAAGYAVSYSANALPTGLSLTGSNIAGTPTVIADSSTLLTATAATTNRTAVRTINWSITVANDPYFEYNTLLIPGASTTFVDDASTNNFAVTINGDTKPNSMNPYSPGYYSNYFDGTGDYLVTPTNSAFTFGTGDLTLECWIYQTATSVSTYRVIFSDNVYGDAGGYSLYTYNNALNLWKGGSEVIAPAGTFALNSWTHVAWTRSGSSNRLFINGTQVGATTTDATNYTSTASYIGASKLGTFAFAGYISNARIVKGTAVYTSNFTPSTTPLTAISGTSLLTCQSNRFIDTSTNNFAITVFGNTTVNSFDPFTPNSNYSTYGSAYFDGTGDYLTLPSASQATLTANSNFTFESYVYLTGYSGTYNGIWGGNSGDIVLAYSSANSWGLYPALAGSPPFMYSGMNVLNGMFNRWAHVALTRNGNSWNLWVDGVSVATATQTSTSIPNTTKSIGSEGAGANPMIGYISDARYTSSAVYTTAFTPPSAPLTAIANTQLLTLQNNQSVNNNVFLDNSTNNFFVTRNGNTTQGTFSPYGGNWSNYFTGSSYLNAGTTASNFLCTGSATGITATFEAWVFPTAYSTGASAWMFSPIHAKGATYFNFGVRNGAVRFYWYDGAYKNVDSTSTSDVPLNTWTHMAVTISGSTIKIYVNGVLNTTSATYTGIASAGANQIEYIGVEGNVPTYFSGYISNYRLNNTVVYSTSFTPSTTPLIAITGTRLLTCQSNSFIDNSNSFAVAVTGSTTVQRFSPFNPSSVTPTSYSVYFDGNGDYLTLSQQTALSLGTGDFTVEAWVYPTANPVSTFYSIMDARGSVVAAPWAAGLRVYSGILKIEFYDGTQIPGSITVPLNAWTHVAFARSGTTLRGFTNGVLDINTTMSTNLNIPAGTQVIGAIVDPGYATGYISNMRVVKGTAVYTSAFVPPTTPLTAIANTSLLTCQSPTFVDNSTNNFTITAFGNSKPTQQNPFGYTSATTTGYTVSTIGGSGYFDGTGDNLSLTTVTAVGTSNTTVEFWFYPTSASVTYRGIYDSRSATDTNTGYGIFQYGLTIEVYGNGLKVASAANAFAINVWNHVALVRTSGTCQLYINGIASGSNGSYSSSLTSTIRRIGDGVTIAYPFVGYISDVREATTSLYTSNFVPPAQPLTAIQNTGLLLNMTSAGIYDDAMMNDMESVGDAKLSTAVSKFGGSSMRFDGTGDYLFSATNIINLSFGTGDFTVECWAYWNAGVADGGFVGSVSNNGMDFAYLSGTLRIGRVNQAWDSTFSSFTPTAAVWYHIAFTRNSGTARVFVNGTQVGSNSTNNNSYAPTGGMTIGTSNTGDRNFNGYLDDLRITKGYARYTSNFTPPTIPFPVY